MTISSEVHDLVFAIGSAVLLIALIPAVIKKSVLPISTALVTGGVLAIFSLNYLTMHFWYAMAVEAANTACWAYLTFLSIAKPKTQ